MRILNPGLVGICSLIACLFVGCGGDPLGRHAISGTVTLDGAPVAKGNLSLQPMEQQPTSSGAVIADGKYTIPRDQGLVAGKYRVSINASAPGAKGDPADALPGMPAPPPKELIPPSWNTNSQQTIDVKKEGPFVF